MFQPKDLVEDVVVNHPLKSHRYHPNRVYFNALDVINHSFMPAI